jgi:hypothetical protein
MVVIISGCRYSGRRYVLLCASVDLPIPSIPYVVIAVYL